ncbi:MAG: class I SAM-dependent methyltransferase [Desulfobacterales bacterium]
MSRPEAYDEKITKLRRTARIAQLEVERVVGLCLGTSRITDLLDVGTGSGLFAEAFALRGVKVFGLDPDPDMIRAARCLVPAVSFHVAAAEALPFAERAVDACFMGMVLHETADPDRSLLEARRVARNLVAVLEWPPAMPTDPPPPARRFDYEEIDRMGRRTGFRDISLFPLTDMVLYRMMV